MSSMMYRNKHLLNILINKGHRKRNYNLINYFSSEIIKDRPVRILGIETSCDDTGIAIVDGTGKILGEALNSQQNIHLQHGGILPPLARDLHRDNIQDVYERALLSAQMKLDDVDAIATTVKPGLPLSLRIGKNFGQNLAKISNKPFIPIHHMEAHALTVRMIEKVDFPFLALLISGGHCLLAFVENVTNFYRLGTTLDDAPGEALDKTARRLRMVKILDYQNKSGGQAIELAASKATNPLQFEFPMVMPHQRSCNFSFSGFKNSAVTLIKQQEKNFNVASDGVIPDLENFCASFQWSIARHIAVRAKRAMIFCDNKNLIPHDKRTLVVSGGVASNNFIAKTLKMVCDEIDYHFVRPPPRLCSDNGIMVAWNGVDRWKVNAGVFRDPAEFEKIDSQGKAPLGEDWTERVTVEDIECHAIKVKEMFP